MWMPSDLPLRNAADDSTTLDWETIGRAIRECVLDALEMHRLQLPESRSDLDSVLRRERGIELE